MLVDVHSHAIPPDLAEPAGAEAYGRWPSVARQGGEAKILVGGRAFRAVDSRCWSARRRIEDLDAAGVDVQVVSPVPVTFCHDAPPIGARALARAQNDFLAGLVADGGGRLRALGAVPLQEPDAAVAELEQVMGELGFSGVEIGTHVAGRALADPVLDEFFAAAESLSAVVLVHPGALPEAARLDPFDLGFGVGMPCETALAAAQLLAGGLLGRRPGIRICLVHGGGALPMLLGRLDKGFEILPGMAERLGERPSVLARRFWADSLTYDAQSLALAVDRFGGDHVMCGSDYPFAAAEWPPGATLGAARVAGYCDDATVSAIRAGNAASLLQLGG